MLDSPSSTPPDSPSSRPITPENKRAWAESLKRQVRPTVETKLEWTLYCITSLFEQSFGAQSKQTWASDGERTKMVLIFIRSIDGKTYDATLAAREEEPLAKAFLDRTDTELRRIIPTLSTEEKATLLRTGYPMGSGTDSLAELCITSERTQSGPSGVVALFAQSHHNGDPIRPWSPDLLRAANAALAEYNPTLVPVYMKGLKAMFDRKSAWAPQALELLDGMAEKVSLEVLVDVYDRARQSKNLAPELKAAVFSALIDCMDHSTGGRCQGALLDLKGREKLPPITPKILVPIRKIAQALAQGLEAPWFEVEKLQQHLGLSPVVRISVETKTKSPAPPRAHTEVSPVPQDAESSLTMLTGEPLRAYLLQAIEQGLADPGSDISKDFQYALERITIRGLISLRPALASLDGIPDIVTQTVGGRIEKELSTVTPKLPAVTLAELYELCVQVSAPKEEVELVLGALRTRLRLPLRSEEVVPQEISPAGMLVWRWIFSDMPPDSALLSDIFRVHFGKTMAHAARSVSVQTTRGSALDAVLHYGEELGLLQSYEPSKSMRELPLWKLVFFTALVREQIGKRDGVVDTLANEIRSRLTTTDARIGDAFPKQWARSASARTVSNLCGDIVTSILNAPTPPSFDELSLLLTNARFFERRGPPQIRRLYEQLRQKFILAIPEIDPRELRTKDNSTLRRLTQALAAARYRSVELLDVLSDEFDGRADSLSTDEFSDVAVALAAVRGGSAAFWSKFAARVAQEWQYYSEDKLTIAIWSLVLAAPEQVPTCFDETAMLSTVESRSAEKVIQALIALGRYAPEPNDRTYKKLNFTQTPHDPLQHEADFMRQLPSLIGVPAESIFSQVVIGGFETDYVVDFGHRRLIIELDGAGHYLTGPDGGILQGRDAFQDIVFRRLGYEVIHIPFDFRYRWNRNHRAIPELKKLADSMKRDALNPSTVRRVYLEPLTSSTEEAT